MIGFRNFFLIKKWFFWFAYSFFFKYLPSSTFPFLGKFFKWGRVACCRQFFAKTGRNINIERNASFGNGFGIEIGDHSGIGRNSNIPNNVVIGKDVMMAPNVFIFDINHEFSDLDRPMREQGYKLYQRCIIEDDVWIGRSVYIMPGSNIKKGSIIAARTVLTKTFPEFSIVGGNPGKLIRSRK